MFEGLPEDDPKVRQPDITRAREVLGWEPQVALEEGLRRTLESLGVAAVRVSPPRIVAAGRRRLRRPTSLGCARSWS